jgi:hypothetical protein
LLQQLLQIHSMDYVQYPIIQLLQLSVLTIHQSGQIQQLLVNLMQ